jgi:hypothetical protein
MATFMRTSVFFVVLLLFHAQPRAQIYERTGKNLGIYLSAQPLSQVSENRSFKEPNTLSGSVGIIHMLRPGIYPSIGYTYNRSQPILSRSGADFPMEQAHIVDAALTIDKQLLKLVNGRRVSGGCHYLSLGLILGPEYHYMFGNEQIKNEGYGEVAAHVGLSFFHFYKSMRKKYKSNTRQFDVFYRRGFTPLLSGTYHGAYVHYYRQEIGIRIRFIRHEVSNFLR